MTLNIILAVVSFIGISIIAIIRKGWKTYLIMLVILTAILIVSGISGLIINPFL